MKGFSLFVFLFVLPLLASSTQKQAYIVYFGEHSGNKALHEIEETHYSYLYSVKATKEEAKSSLLYSYKRSINGFAALLTPDEASKLSELEEVVSVFPSHPRKYSTQTTRSWEFVGLDEDGFRIGEDCFLRKARYGKNVVIAVLDSGVWPESKSFSDKGMGPIPKSWKGICQTGVAFNSSHCNRKIIGARYYIKAFENYYGPNNISLDTRSPRDLDGHGTHTASTAAGRQVRNAAAYGGFARGTASGGAPLARLAIYKACWAIPNQEKVAGNTCFEADMLAAFDDAIADGVNVMSVSIGATHYLPYANDGIAIGSLHAAKHDIVVACAAGNDGPAPATLSNTAPWIITVGASSVDRAFLAPVFLGNGQRISGQTVSSYKLKKRHPLVFAADVVHPYVPSNVSSQCLPHSLSPEKVKGKIVLCMRGLGLRIAKGMEVKRAGGAGFILGNSPVNGNELAVDAHVLPAATVNAKDAIEIQKYINSTKYPMAIIGEASTILNYRPAPFMAAFSSRGPSIADPNILKPDITAPGLNILAAWSGGDSPTKLSRDKRIVKYNIESGTSMACPHVAAAAALIKAIHPTWSSAAIRSALMTTAGMRNNFGRPITDPSGIISTPFQLGSGHLQPSKAADPGLVYDASYRDYIIYLCNYGIKNPDPTIKCPEVLTPTYNLNYPSIAIPKINGTVTIHRTVTNVGPCKSVYFFTAIPPLGFSVKASPRKLIFDEAGQKRSFTITITAKNKDLAEKLYREDYVFGSYSWTDHYHFVRSPIAVSLA